MRSLTTATLALLIVLTGVLVGAPQQARAQVAQRCFPETGFCIEGRIREFWEQNGGLPVFGFPIAPQGAAKIEGRDLIVQQFERNRLELHPENARSYDVLLGRLGADRLGQQGRDWQAVFPKEGAQGGCRFFPETGHSVCGAILNAWRANGLEIDGKRGKTEAENLALFGLPLSGLVTETLSDGKQYQIQWFERARFEIHPENAPPYDVLLGLLGRETAGGSAQQPTQPGQPADPCADAPQPKNGRIRPSNCVKVGTPIEVDIFGFQPNEQIGYWLTTPEGDIFGSRETLNIGPAGAVNGLPLSTRGLYAGIWYFVFQGVSSGNQSVVYFKVLNEDGTGPAPAKPAPPVGDVPASQSATATPDRGPKGTRFAFVAGGFKPGEQIGVYSTAPDKSVYGAPFQVTADSSGSNSEVTFRSSTSSDFPTGVWALTFEGIDSGHKAIAYFAVTP